MHDDPDLIALAEQQYGLVALRQVRALGASQAQTDRLARSVQWERLTRNVLRRRGTPESPEQRAMAAVLDAGGDAALSHRSGAGWTLVPGCRLEPLCLVTTKHARRRTQLARTHEVRDLPPYWVTTFRGVRVCRPELLATQIYAECHPERAEVLVERMWTRRLLTGATIAEFLDQCGRSGRNGITGLRGYFEPRGVDYVPLDSGLELRAKQVLERAGWSTRHQVNVGDERWTGRVDLLLQTLPIVVEIQSAIYHQSLLDRASDDRRIQRLLDDGFSVVEIVDDDVWFDPRAVVEDVEVVVCHVRGGGSAVRFNRRTGGIAGQNA